MTLDELTDHCSAFPLRQILDTAGYSYDGIYLVVRPDYFDRLDELYTDENIDEIRSCLIVSYIRKYAEKLDRETYDQITGAQFDENGSLKNWWTEEDSKEFKRRVGKMDDYLDGIVAFGDEHFIGTNVDTEMDADMTGLQCALRMASKVDDFDYDKFFKKYAQLNAILMLYSSELSNLKQDEHPLYYSRTNVPVQQFEEFYETYGVKEGDNMYLAPEDRLILW